MYEREDIDELERLLRWNNYSISFNKDHDHALREEKEN